MGESLGLLFHRSSDHHVPHLSGVAHISRAFHGLFRLSLASSRYPRTRRLQRPGQLGGDGQGQYLLAESRNRLQVQPTLSPRHSGLVAVHSRADLQGQEFQGRGGLSRDRLYARRAAHVGGHAGMGAALQPQVRLPERHVGRPRRGESAELVRLNENRALCHGHSHDLETLRLLDVAVPNRDL